jgi:amidase
MMLLPSRSWSAALLLLPLGSGVLAAGAADLFGLQFTPSVFPLEENANTTELFPVAKCGSFVLEEATIDQMQEAMRNGTLTSVQLALCYLFRTYQTEQYIK